MCFNRKKTRKLNHILFCRTLKNENITVNFNLIYVVFLEASVAAVSSPVVQEEEESVQFSKLSYLGCTWVKAPRSENEAQKAMATLRAESPSPIPVILHIPNNPNGCVR